MGVKGGTMKKQKLNIIELLPCPFCGMPATQPENETLGKTPTWMIRCASWCIVMRRKTKKTVIHDWNTRV